MTDNKFIDAFKRMLTMTLAMIMVLGSVIPIATQEASAFGGKVGSKYTVTDGGQIRYGSGDGGYSNSRKCDLGDDLGSINTFYDDNMRNLLEEVYHAGFQDGYSNAIFKLQLFEGRSIFAAADKEFFEKNSDKIKRRIEAIREYETDKCSKFKIPESQEELDACNDEISEMFYGDDTDEYGLSKQE